MKIKRARTRLLFGASLFLKSNGAFTLAWQNRWDLSVFKPEE
jgi:hypothetical protein